MLTNRTHDQQILWGCLFCIIGSLFYCYEFILRILPGILQSELTAAFGNISATSFGQLVSLFYFAYSPMQLPVGMLMDRYGPRKLLTFACCCCVLGSWLFSLTFSMLLAGTGRFLVGFGSAFAFVGVLSLAINWLPRQLFSLVAGLLTTLGMLCLIYGEIKITDLATVFGWHDVLSIMIIIGLIGALIIFFVIRDGKQTFQAKESWQDFLANVWQVLTSVQVWLIGFIGACMYTSLSVFGELWGKGYLECAHHLTKTEAAQSISAVFLGWAIGAPLAGYLSDYSGRRVSLLFFSALMALLCISIVLYYPNLTYTWLMIFLFLYGVFSSTEIIVFIMGKEYSGAQLSGTVFAVVNMIVSLGGVILQPLVGKLLDFASNNKLKAEAYIYTTADYQLALAVLPVTLILVIFSAYFIQLLVIHFPVIQAKRGNIHINATKVSTSISGHSTILPEM